MNSLYDWSLRAYCRLDLNKRKRKIIRGWVNDLMSTAFGSVFILQTEAHDQPN